MRKKINIDEIKNVNTSMIVEIENLKKYKKQLELNIDEIKNYYVGKDANTIVNDYKTRCEILNIIITNYENYSRYIGNVSNSYEESVESAKKQFESQIIDMENNKLSNNYVVND